MSDHLTEAREWISHAEHYYRNLDEAAGDADAGMLCAAIAEAYAVLAMATATAELHAGDCGGAR